MTYAEINKIRDYIQQLKIKAKELEERERKIIDILNKDIETLKKESEYAIEHYDALAKLKQTEKILNIYREGETNERRDNKNIK